MVWSSSTLTYCLNWIPSACLTRWSDKLPEVCEVPSWQACSSSCEHQVLPFTCPQCEISGKISVLIARGIRVALQSISLLDRTVVICVWFTASCAFNKDNAEGMGACQGWKNYSIEPESLLKLGMLVHFSWEITFGGGLEGVWLSVFEIGYHCVTYPCWPWIYYTPGSVWVLGLRVCITTPGNCTLKYQKYRSGP